MNIALIILLVFGFFILLSSFFTVKQQTAVVVERFGKFLSIRQSGLHLKIPLIDRIAGRVNLKIQQLDVIIETKTKDNVFVKLKVSVQFMVIKETVYDAFYKLEYPHDQITSYVFDVVRAEVPKLIPILFESLYLYWEKAVIEMKIKTKLSDIFLILLEFTKTNLKFFCKL